VIGRPPQQYYHAAQASESLELPIGVSSIVPIDSLHLLALRAGIFLLRFGLDALAEPMDQFFAGCVNGSENLAS
jgi:hypothetical protein